MSNKKLEKAVQNLRDMGWESGGWTKKPHWTRTPPTEPGWKAVEFNPDPGVLEGEVIAVKVEMGRGDEMLIYSPVDDDEWLSVNDGCFIRWHSEPITLPPLPGDDA